MSMQYYLKIGGSKLFQETFEAELNSAEEKIKTRAQGVLSSRLRGAGERDRANRAIGS